MIREWLQPSCILFASTSSVLGWMKKYNNSAFNGLTGNESNPIDPSKPDSNKVFVTGEESSPC